MMGYSESEIGIQLISPSLGVELFAKTQNISSLYQKIMANEDAEEIVWENRVHVDWFTFAIEII